MTAPTIMSVRGQTVPYVTLAEVKRSPIYTQLEQLIPDGSARDNDAELESIILRVSAMINGECNQNLAATEDREIGRARISDDGELRINTRCNPIIDVLSVKVGDGPGNLVPVTDLTGIVLEPWRITIPSWAIVSTGWGRPAQRVYAEWTYINGFPITTLAAPAAVGDTTITVTTTTGIAPGRTELTVEDGKYFEKVRVLAVDDNAVTVDPLMFAHQSRVGVHALPPDIQEAALLLISRLHDTWSLSMRAIASDGTGAQKPPPGPARAMCDAAVMLAPYKRIW